MAGLAAGATDSGSLRVGLNTATAGVFAGTTSTTFASHDGDLVDLALDSATVALHGQVNNFAEASLTKTGGAGTPDPHAATPTRSTSARSRSAPAASSRASPFSTARSVRPTC